MINKVALDGRLTVEMDEQQPDRTYFKIKQFLRSNNTDSIVQLRGD